MILIAGGTGLLGRQVVERLVARGVSLRVLTRDVGHGREALGSLADQVDLVAGDVRDPASLAAAVAEADTVVAAVQGFGGREAGGLAAVDREGNLNLVRASAAAGVSHYLLLSIHDATAADPLALGRAKAAVEAELRTTTMIPIQVRPTAYMETWAGIVGGPILASGKARIFGRGRNPINFVSSADVAVVVDAELARVLADPADASPRTLEVVGPEDLSLNAIVECFAGSSAGLFRPRTSRSRCSARWRSASDRSSRSSPTRSMRRSFSTPRTAAPGPRRPAPSGRWSAASRHSTM